MNYEAKIGGLWYPVEILYKYSQNYMPVSCVSVKVHRTWSGGRMRACPFDESSPTAGVVNLSTGTVLDSNIRETTDDPLETVYPKKE